MMRKIVINTLPDGDFGLSRQAHMIYELRAGKKCASHEIRRDDPILVGVVEELGDMANDSLSRLRIVEIPADVEWWISINLDRQESIAEKHRTWGLEYY